MTPYFVVCCSLVMFILIQLKRLHVHHQWLSLVFMVLIIVPSASIYQYLTENLFIYEHNYKYDSPYLDFKLINGDIWDKRELTPQRLIELKAQEAATPNIIQYVYYGVKPYVTLSENVNWAVLHNYRRHRFRLYDLVEKVDDQNIDYLKIEQAFFQDQNVAFVPMDFPHDFSDTDLGRMNPQALSIEGNSDSFEILHYDVMSIPLNSKLIFQLINFSFITIVITAIGRLS